MKSPLKTVIASELLDELDEGFGSPLDGVVAIDQLYLELTCLHVPVRSRILSRLRPSKVYYGRYDWYPLGFRYVQLGDELHVQDLFIVTETGLFRRRKFGVVLGREDGEFSLTYEPGVHGTIALTDQIATKGE